MGRRGGRRGDGRFRRGRGLRLRGRAGSFDADRLRLRVGQARELARHLVHVLGRDLRRREQPSRFHQPSGLASLPRHVLLPHLVDVAELLAAGHAGVDERRRRGAVEIQVLE